MKRGLLLLSVVGLVGGCSRDPQVRTTPCFVAVGDAPVRGPADAWVTMIEFSDFQCPYCGDAETKVRQLLTSYSTDLRLAYRHFPLTSIHPRAMPAAVAAWCAGQQGQFWGMHDLLFDNQTHLADSDLAGYASTLSLDLTAWQSCIASSAATAAVTADLDFGLQIGVVYTPTFLINGIPLVGDEAYSVFADVVDEALATAQADGTPQASYYDHAVTTVGCQ